MTISISLKGHSYRLNSLDGLCSLEKLEELYVRIDLILPKSEVTICVILIAVHAPFLLFINSVSTCVTMYSYTMLFQIIVTLLHTSILGASS